MTRASFGKARTAEVKPLQKEKNEILSELKSFKKLLAARTKVSQPIEAEETSRRLSNQESTGEAIGNLGDRPSSLSWRRPEW